jgi:hypothetical protein
MVLLGTQVEMNQTTPSCLLKTCESFPELEDVIGWLVGVSVGIEKDTCDVGSRVNDVMPNTIC